MSSYKYALSDFTLDEGWEMVDYYTMLETIQTTLETPGD